MSQKINANPKGFTITELIIVLAILSILTSLAIPEVFSAIRETKAAQCGASIRLIEGAKMEWRKRYPGARNPTRAELEVFFPGGQFPQDPWKMGFRNGPSGDYILSPNSIVQLDTVTAHDFNGNCKYEPSGDCSTTNGYNDASQPKR